MTTYNAKKRIQKQLQNGKMVRVSTLVKNDMTDIIKNKDYNDLIKFSKKHPNPIKIIKAIDIEKPQMETKSHKITTKKMAMFDSNDIIKFIENYYIKNNSTQKTYLYKYTKTPYFTSMDLLDDTKFDKLIDIKNDSSVKHILSPISIYLKNNQVGQFPNLLKKISNTIGEAIQYEQSRAIQRSQSQLPITAEEMIDKFDKYLETGDLGRHQSEYQKNIDGLILGLYAFLPLRDDFGKVTFVDNLNKKMNFLNLETNQITILGKKGMKENRTFDITEELMNLIITSLKEYPREFLFIKSDGLPFGKMDKQITKTFKRIFPNIEKVTINDIRRAFTKYSEIQGEDKYIQMAQKQGHSLATARIFYTRND